MAEALSSFVDVRPSNLIGGCRWYNGRSDNGCVMVDCGVEMKAVALGQGVCTVWVRVEYERRHSVVGDDHSIVRDGQSLDEPVETQYAG